MGKGGSWRYRDSGEMGRGSDERMNVERTTDRAVIDGVMFLTVMVDGNYLWISAVLYCL